MVFKFVVFAAALAYANAGLLGAPAVATYSAAPVATYSAAPVAIHAPAIGASQQSVVRSLGGNQAISTYSKAVDSAFSSVRKYDTRVTNDALTYAHAPVVSTYAAAPVAVAHAAPVVSTYAAAPVAVAHAPLAVAHAPVVARTAAIGYSPAAVVSHVTFSGLGASYGW